MKMNIKNNNTIEVMVDYMEISNPVLNSIKTNQPDTEKLILKEIFYNQDFRDQLKLLPCIKDKSGEMSLNIKPEVVLYENFALVTMLFFDVNEVKYKNEEDIDDPYKRYDYEKRELVEEDIYDLVKYIPSDLDQAKELLQKCSSLDINEPEFEKMLMFFDDQFTIYRDCFFGLNDLEKNERQEEIVDMYMNIKLLIDQLKAFYEDNYRKPTNTVLKVSFKNLSLVMNLLKSQNLIVPIYKEDKKYVIFINKEGINEYLLLECSEKIEKITTARKLRIEETEIPLISKAIVKNYFSFKEGSDI